MLFGSVTDVLDRYLPDAEKHGALRGMLSFLAINTTYRGPATPGTAAALAFGLAVPDENAKLMKKLRGGIGALTAHLVDTLAAGGGELRLRSKVEEILTTDGRVTGVRLEDGSTIGAKIVVSAVAPDLTSPSSSTRTSCRATCVSVLQGRPPRQLSADALRPRRYADVRRALRVLNDPEMQSAIGLFSTPEELQQQWEDSRRGIVPADPAIAMQFPSVHDPALAPPGKHAISAFSMWFPIETGEASYGDLKVEMGRRVIEKITRLAPDFESRIIRHTTFTPKHMGTMFGAPGGDYCHGLIHPEQMGPNRPGPTGYIDQPLPIDGLYLGSAGCHGGPGITFIPGYNAATAALASTR